MGEGGDGVGDVAMRTTNENNKFAPFHVDISLETKGGGTSKEPRRKCLWLYPMSKIIDNKPSKGFDGSCCHK